MKPLFLATLALVAAQCATPKISVGWEEARHNLISAFPVIRTDESRRHHHSIPVLLTVDVTGQVVNAEALGPSPFRDRAVALAKALRFQPFLRNGVAVDALIEQHVLLLPPERAPSRRVDFPEVKELSSLTFSLTRTGCLGSCPIYDVRISGDGQVTYSGVGFVAVVGKHTDHISAERVQELLEAFRRADFYSLDDEYKLGATDLPAHIVSIQIGNKAKNVVDYSGDQVGMPLAVSDLERKIDAISGAAKWLQGNGETVSSLRREGFDFSSEAAGKILNRVAESGDETAVLDLIHAGAPIGTVHGPETALSNAAASGKLRAVELLIQLGADPKEPFVLMQAARSGSPAVLRRILGAGADVRANLPGVKLLLFSVVSSLQRTGEDVDRGAVVRLLVEAGADPNVRNEHYNIPLHGDIDPAAASALIEAGADVNARNKNGETPLMWTSSELVAEILLKAGADISIRSKGKTPLEFNHGGHQAKIAALIEKASRSQK